MFGLPPRTCFHIFTPFKRVGLKFYHHGVLLSDGMVIHLHPDVTIADANKKRQEFHTKGKLLRTTLDEFRTFQSPDGKGERKMIVYQFNHWFQLPNETIENRARAELLKSQTYNLVFRNCETFARWCVTNIAISKQVIQRAGAVSGGAAVAGSSTALYLAIRNMHNPRLLAVAGAVGAVGVAAKLFEYTEDHDKILDGDSHYE